MSESTRADRGEQPEVRPGESARDGLVQVLVADDHPVVREGLRRVLDGDERIRVVAEAARGDEAVQLAKQHVPDIVVVDSRMPGVDGIEVCAQLCERDLGSRVVVFSQFADESVVERALQAGAKGFVAKESDPEVLLTGIHQVASGLEFVDPRVADKLDGSALPGRRAEVPYGLTGQEMRVLALLPKGLSKREMAVELGLSVDTVKTHVRNTLRKLEVADRAEAAALAVREGLA